MQTVKGTLEYMNIYKLSPQELISAVATKGGVTEAIVNDLLENRVPQQYEAAFDKGKLRVDAIKG
jgi:pyrroline-5-carboxylate reductase